MSDFFLSYQFKEENYCEVNEIPGGKYSSVLLCVDFYIDEKTSKRAIENFENNKKFMKNLNLGFFTIKTIANFLKNSDNLEKLQIFDINHNEEEIPEIVNLHKLKHLELFKSFKILKLIKAENLKYLKIFDLVKNYYEEYMLIPDPLDDQYNFIISKGAEFSSFLNNFLKQCKNLKVITNFY